MHVETSSVNHLDNIQSVDLSKMSRMFTTSHYPLGNKAEHIGGESITVNNECAFNNNKGD